MSVVDREGAPRRKKRISKRAKRQHRDVLCPLCNQQRSFAWTCECGVVICQECMQRDIWGYTCNNLTWVCPDCGAVHSY